MEEILPKIQIKKILGESFEITKQKICEIVSTQAIYFFALLLATLASAYIEYDSQIVTFSAAIQLITFPAYTEYTPLYFLTSLKFMIPAAVLYFLNRPMLDNLYVSMKTGAAIPNFKISWANKTTGKLMKLDIKGFAVTYLPAIGWLIVIPIVAAVVTVSKIAIPEAVKVSGIFLAALYLLNLVVFRGLVLSAAQPIVYEDTPIALMKGFYKLSKGCRWKIFFAKLLIYAAVVIVSVSLSFVLIKMAGNSSNFNQLPHTPFYIKLIKTAVVSLTFTLCALWDVHFNWLLWKRLRTPAPELRITPAA